MLALSRSSPLEDQSGFWNTTCLCLGYMLLNGMVFTWSSLLAVVVKYYLYQLKPYLVCDEVAATSTSAKNLLIFKLIFWSPVMYAYHLCTRCRLLRTWLAGNIDRVPHLYSSHKNMATNCYHDAILFYGVLWLCYTCCVHSVTSFLTLHVVMFCDSQF